MEPLEGTTSWDGTTAIQSLMDRNEIRELTARYNRAFDDVQPAAFASVFTDDGFMLFEGERHDGSGALEELVRATGYGFVHVTSDPIIDIDGDSAHQSCTLIVCNRRRDRLANPYVMSGRYEDDLVRTKDGWRFTRRTITLDLAPSEVEKLDSRG
jgi:hypothetical protein